MFIRQAHAEDVETIVAWRAEAAEWLAERGHDQWSGAGLDDTEFRTRVTASIAAGETWMVISQHGDPIGTIAVDDDADPGLWSQEERQHAVIAHRMIVPRFASGLGVGSLLLRQAETVAQQRHRLFIRLDAWTSNPDLHAYYQRAGFRHVRTVTAHHTPSAALFERRVWSVPMPELPLLAGICDP